MPWAALTLLLVGAFVAAVGVLVTFVVRAAWAVRSASAAARERLRRELASLDTEQLRARLANDGYFDADMRKVPAIEQFLSGIRAGDETALAARYSRRRLYGLLVRAERHAKERSGRPEAIDTIDEIYEALHELARRGRRP